MKKMLLVITIGLVSVTTVVFFIYPFLQNPPPGNPEGVYIRYTEHEFGKEWDTLAIYKDVGSATHYLMVRRWKYERVVDGHALTPEYKIQKASAEYLEKEKLLVEEESGVRYRINERQNELGAGTTIYKKMK